MESRQRTKYASQGAKTRVLGCGLTWYPLISSGRGFSFSLLFQGVQYIHRSTLTKNLFRNLAITWFLLLKRLMLWWTSYLPTQRMKLFSLRPWNAAAIPNCSSPSMVMYVRQEYRMESGSFSCAHQMEKK